MFSFHTRVAVVAGLVCIGPWLSGCANTQAGTASSPSREPSEAIAKASPEQLAQSWLTNEHMASLTAAARTGATIEISGTVGAHSITSANADSYAAAFAARRAIVEAEIERRGYSEVAGHYGMTGNKACAEAGPSGYLTGRAALSDTTTAGDAVSISQQKFRVIFSDTLAVGQTGSEPNAEPTTIKSRGAVVAPSQGDLD